MSMKLFIPTDRVGLENFQKSISGTTTAVNELLRAGVKVEWFTSPVRLSSTNMWPEGHLYMSGYAVPNEDCVKEVLDKHELKYTATDELPETCYVLGSSRICVYYGRGAGVEFADPLVEVFSMGGFEYDKITDEEIRAGKLMEYDIFVVPGSPDAGECYYAGLGDAGFEEVRKFVRERGNYMGVCGGAYFPLTSYNTKNPYWLNAVEATDVEDLDFWRTGSGHVKLRVDDNDHPVFTSVAMGVTTSINIVYWEGPAIQVKGASVRSLAHFEELTATGRGPLKPEWNMFNNTMAQEAITDYYNPLTEANFDKHLKNRSAIVEADYGQNKFLLYSPHAEMGNTGYAPREDSMNFQLLFNGLLYLSVEK